MSASSFLTAIAIAAFLIQTVVLNVAISERDEARKERDQAGLDLKAMAAYTNGLLTGRGCDLPGEAK